MAKETKPAKPRTFSYHWGSGIVAEEARVEGEFHVPALQLLRYTEGDAAGGESIRFCYYNHRGMYQRAPLVLSEPEIDALRTALRQKPALLALLRRLVE